MLGGVGGFVRASKLVQSHRKTRKRQLQQQARYQQPTFRFINNNRFQLYNQGQRKWANQIDKPPILLTEQELKNWLSFKVNKLKENQLYLWHATQFDWVPLWSCDKGFLLINLNIIKFDKVNFLQFTKAAWIKENAVALDAVKILLKQFHIPMHIAENMQPIITSNIQNEQVAATGQPYFYTQNITNYNKIRINNENRYGWGTNRWFDIRDDRYNYQFLKEFKQTFHFSNNPTNASQVKNFRAALQHAPEGTYFYHKRDIYVPYRLNHGMITFNRGDAVDVKHIHNSLNQNRCINTNAYNKLRWKQYEMVWNLRKSMFIDPKDGSYRSEYIMNYIQTIIYNISYKSTFDSLFDNYSDLSTFMLLDNTGIYGVPIGINKNTKSIILNEGSWLTWNEFKTRFHQNKIDRYQNLDFKGYEMFFNDNNFVNNNFKPPCLQIEKIDLNKIEKSSFLSCFIGQFVIIDYGNNENVLPIYIYSPKIFRTNDHVVMLNDIVKYVEYHPNALLPKFKVDLNNNMVIITSSNCALSENWNSYIVQNHR